MTRAVELRAQAKRIRQRAAGFHNLILSEQLIDIAAQYERLAWRLTQRDWGR